MLAFGSSDVLRPDDLVDPTREVALRFHRVSLRAIVLPSIGVRGEF